MYTYWLCLRMSFMLYAMSEPQTAPANGEVACSLDRHVIVELGAHPGPPQT